MSTGTIVWLGLLTLALIAHMFKDAREFRKIATLERSVNNLEERANKSI